MRAWHPTEYWPPYSTSRNRHYYIEICTNFAYAINFERSEKCSCQTMRMRKKSSSLNTAAISAVVTRLLFYCHKPQATHSFNSQMHILISIRTKINSAFHASPFHPRQAYSILLMVISFSSYGITIDGTDRECKRNKEPESARREWVKKSDWRARPL